MPETRLQPWHGNFKQDYISPYRLRAVTQGLIARIELVDNPNVGPGLNVLGKRAANTFRIIASFGVIVEHIRPRRTSTRVHIPCLTWPIEAVSHWYQVA